MKRGITGTAISTVIVLIALGCGCGSEMGTVDADREIRVHAVSHYGVDLNEQASPGDVAYVLLRAIREDFLAKSAKVRRTALDIQRDVCAADVLAQLNATGLSRDRWINQTVPRWTPTAAHYVRSFPMTLEDARQRVATFPWQKGATASELDLYEAAVEADDPSGNPNARVVVRVKLIRNSGFWRVVGVGFDPDRRRLTQAG